MSSIQYGHSEDCAERCESAFKIALPCLQGQAALSGTETMPVEFQMQTKVWTHQSTQPDINPHSAPF